MYQSIPDLRGTRWDGVEKLGWAIETFSLKNTRFNVFCGLKIYLFNINFTKKWNWNVEFSSFWIFLPCRHFGHCSCLHIYTLVLSAWVWQELDAPVFAPLPSLLHSHSMTGVKRTSSFHESSHSTRTRSRVSKKQVILSVSRASETMSRVAQKVPGDTHDTIPPSHPVTHLRHTGPIGRRGIATVTSAGIHPGSSGFLPYKITFAKKKSKISIQIHPLPMPSGSSHFVGWSNIGVA